MLQVLGPSTGGIRRHVLEISHRLRQRGWEVEVAAPRGVVDAALDHVADIPPGLAPARIVTARRQVAAAAVGADLVHAHGLKAGWLTSTLKGRPPLVVTVHNLVLREAAGPTTPLLQWLEARLPARADRVIAVSDEIATRYGHPPSMVVIPPAGPAPVVRQSRVEARQHLGIGVDVPLAVTVARLHPQKDIPTLLRAIATVPEVHLAVVGVGPSSEELAALANELRLGDRVHFAGHLDNPGDLIAAADVAVVSSIWESGPLALFEAMLLGRPVVSTPVGLAATLVVDGDTGRLVPLRDPAAMADAIRWVLADRQRADAMGERGRTTAAAAVGSDRLVDEIEAVYRSALGR